MKRSEKIEAIRGYLQATRAEIARRGFGPRAHGDGPRCFIGCGLYDDDALRLLARFVPDDMGRDPGQILGVFSEANLTRCGLTTESAIAVIDIALLSLPIADVPALPVYAEADGN